MAIYKILLYFGLSFSLIQIIKLFPLKTALWPKTAQQILLFIIHIIIIFFIPNIGPVPVCGLFLITALLTLVADNLKTRFYQRFFSCYLEQSSLPELNLWLNWDFHSLALVNLKKIFSALQHDDKTGAAAILEQVRAYPGLDHYQLWHQDLLQVLHYTNQREMAQSYIASLELDLSLPGISYGLVSILMNIHLTANNGGQAYADLVYMLTHYRDANHHLLNLSNIMIFFAQTGNVVDFNRHLAANPGLLKNRVAGYWQAILLLRTGNREEATRALSAFRQELPPGLEYFRYYVDTILENPGLYPPVTEIVLPGAVPDATPPPATPLLPESGKSRPGFSIYVLCGIIAAITSIQFLLSLPASIQDFFLQSGAVNYDYIRTGAYSYPLVVQGQWIRIITAIFLHGNWLHLILNLYGLFSIGRFIARAYGSRQLFFIFLFSGIMGNLLSHFIDKLPAVVGASGGVFGLMAAFLFYIIRKRKALQKEQYYRFLVNFAVIMGINIVYGLQNPVINNTAHIAGFISGGLAAIGCLYAMELQTPLKKIFDTGTRLFTILVFVVTVSLWPGILFYDYPGKTGFTREVTADGYSYSVAASWKKDKEGKWTDPLAGIIVAIDRERIPENPDNASSRPGTQEYTREQLQQLLASADKTTMWQVHKDVTALTDGWYFFALKQGKVSPYNYKYYFYVKLFPTSFCWVQSLCPGKYADQDEVLLLRFLSTIKETDRSVQ